MATYAELREQDFKRQIEFNNIKKYHDAGFKGKGITVLNAEHDGDHREMTSKAFKDYAPDATLLEGAIGIRASGDKVIEATVNLNGDRICLEDAIDKYNIKIITRSYSGKTPNATLNYFKDLQKRKGVIFVNSAGNEPYENGVWSKDNTAITVSACQLKEDGSIIMRYFGSKGEVDFTGFMARGIGTSASAPAIAAMIALLLEKYGDFTQEECVEILKSISIKLPNIEDYKQGWGLPILPLTEKLEILERLRGEKMDFKDVEQDRWSKNFIKMCVDEGLMQGYPDGTFKPGASVTREELAVVLARLLDKIEGRI
jgi:hypothetical protein